MPISHQRRLTKRRSILGDRRGFTLTEILVVVALIALLSAVALPSISNLFKVSLRSLSRELATAIRESYNSTVITGRVHRVVYDLDNGQYWVESGPEGALLDSAAARERKEQEKRWAKSDEVKPDERFKLEKTVTRKKQTLPSGVKFVRVRTDSNRTGVTEGVAYTHFFPQGITEPTVIQLSDSENHAVSLEITSTIGKTRLIEGEVTESGVFSEKK